jgi:hypothetical protein
MGAIKLRRYKQKPGECAVAAVASVANHYDKLIDYDFVREVAKPDGEGMYTPDIARLLNTLGFRQVTVVSADLHQLDFKWKDLSKPALVKALRKSAKEHTDRAYRQQAKTYAEFIGDKECDNQLVIDRHFGNHIRKAIGQGVPVLASFNWNLFFEYPKWGDDNRVDPIRGDFEEHEVVIYDCDDKGVRILDSHHELYKARLSKYSNGRYTIDWETLMTVIGFGDLIIPRGFVGNELV